MDSGSLRPLSVCLEEIRRCQLEIVLPDFLAPLCEIQAVSPSRRGMLPAIRSFIDFLSAHCVSEVAERQIKRHTGGGHRENVRFWTSRYPLQRVLVESQQCAEAKREGVDPGGQSKSGFKASSPTRSDYFACAAMAF